MKVYHWILLLCFLNSNSLKGQETRAASLTFAGEAVPLEYKFVAIKLKNTINSTYKSKKSLSDIKLKTQYYFPFIEAMLIKNGIPIDFKYLPIVESDLIRSAKSDVGAGGFWQFMPNTAKELGLAVHASADERESMVKSTLAACNHLKYLYKIFKNWTLVAAAYNVGAGNIQKSISRQRISNYYFLKLNDETATYVYKLIAVKIIFEGNQSKQNVDEPSSEVKASEKKEKRPKFNSGLKKISIDSLEVEH